MLGKHFLGFFDNRKFSVVIGLLCITYFVVFFITDEKFIAKIFPPFHYWYYVGLGVVVCIAQVIIWLKFNLFDNKPFFHLYAWILYFSEFALIMFCMALISWPFYVLYLFFAYLARIR